MVGMRATVCPLCQRTIDVDVVVNPMMLFRKGAHLDGAEPLDDGGEGLDDSVRCPAWFCAVHLAMSQRFVCVVMTRTRHGIPLALGSAIPIQVILSTHVDCEHLWAQV